MNKSSTIVLVFSFLTIGAISLTIGLQEQAYDNQMERLDAAVSEAEADLGVVEEDSTIKTPPMKRAIDLNRRLNSRMAENQAMLDSLIEVENETVGEYVAGDSTENDY